MAVDDFVVLDPFVFVDFLFVDLDPFVFVSLDPFALVLTVFDPFESIE